MPLKSASPSQEKVEQAKLLYDAGVAPISEVLKLLGMSAGQFRTFRLKHGWPSSPRARTNGRRSSARMERPGASG